MVEPPAQFAESLQQLASAATTLVPCAMLIADDSGQVKMVNPLWVEISDLEPEESLGSGWLEAVGGEWRKSLKEDVNLALTTGAETTRDVAIIGASGTRWSRVRIARESPADGTAILVIGVVDIHDDRERERALLQMASHDQLTSVMSRAFFFESVEHALERRKRSGGHIGLLYIDLDGFKRVNDEAGHAAGDRVLSTVAKRVKLSVRSSDLVGRLGGDEFAVLIEPLSSTEEAEIVVQRVQNEFFGPFIVDGRAWAVSLSVGLAISGNRTETAESLVQRADRDMFAAKRSKNVFVPMADVRDPESARRTARELTEIHKSLEVICQRLGDLTKFWTAQVPVRTR